jgi:glyceraldehyde 3-phosphate dehydrogenase
VYGKKVSFTDDAVVVDGKTIHAGAERDPSKLPWGDLGAELVVESTGVFRQKAQCMRHIDGGGAKKVLLSVPPKDDVDAIIVMGVNDDTLKDSDQIVSNASCTTNCLAPVAKVLHEQFEIKRGLMTTTHAYTNDQQVHDMPHKDLRRARAACVSIIPTTTGAAKAVGKVLPALKGKLDGMAMRVPVPNGSVVDLVVELGKTVTPEKVNAVMKAAAEGPLRGILEYCEDPIVSHDIIGNPASSIFDSLCTAVLNGEGTLIKVISWYDNEWGYSCRCIDLLKKMAS